MVVAKLRELIIRLWETLRPGRGDDDLEEELRVHRELAEAHARRGAEAPEQAARGARIRAGGTAQAMEALRDQHSVPWLRDLGRDVRYQPVVKVPLHSSGAASRLTALLIG